jgi:transposase
MNTNKTKTNKKPTEAQANLSHAEPKAQTIKLGIDVHLDRYVAVRIVDGGTPQPPQRFAPAEFMLWVAKQLALAEKVFTCYEAGPFGYSLHRQLEKLEVTNYVVRPRDWDEYGKKVKTDKRDAKQLALHLDRYVSGNHDTFCVIRVPTPEQEQERSISRQRESFQRERQRLAAQGRSHALYYGEHLQGEWWREEPWKTSAVQLPAIVVNLLEPLRRLIAALEVELKTRTKEVEAAAPAQLPVGLGKLTSQIGARSRRLEPLPEPAPGGQLHGLMSERGQLQRPPLSRLDQQARQPAASSRPGRMPVAFKCVSTGISPRQKVAARTLESQDQPAAPQENYCGDGASLCRGLVASAHRPLQSGGSGLGAPAGGPSQNPAQIETNIFA